MNEIETYLISDPLILKLCKLLENCWPVVISISKVVLHVGQILFPSNSETKKYISSLEVIFSNLLEEKHMRQNNLVFV